MNITCLIVEDEPLARSLLEQYVQKVPSLQLLQSCASPLDAMEFLRNHAVDILFLDIQMPEITGITLLKILQHPHFMAESLLCVRTTEGFVNAAIIPEANGGAGRVFDLIHTSLF